MRCNCDTRDWKRISAPAEGFTSYISKTNYSIGGLQDLKLGKIVGFLPCSAEEAIGWLCIDEVKHLFDRKQRESNLCKVIKAGDNNSNPYDLLVYNYGVNIGGVFRRRNYTLVTTIVYDTERMCYAIVGKTGSCYNELAGQYHLKKNQIQAEQIYGYSFYRISENLTRFVHVSYNDTKLPKFIVDNAFGPICITRARALHQGFLDMMKYCQENNVTPNEKDHPRYALIEEFKRKFIQGGEKKTWEVDYTDK